MAIIFCIKDYLGLTHMRLCVSPFWQKLIYFRWQQFLSQIYAARPDLIEMDGEVGYNHRKESEVGHEAISHRN